MSNVADVFPTSTFDVFKQMVNNPNKPFGPDVVQQSVSKLKKIVKNIVLSFVSDSAGCGHVRNIFPLSYLNAEFGKTNRFNLIKSQFFINQPDILAHTRSIFFQRHMHPSHVDVVRQYKQLQSQFKYKMIYDIDDHIWEGDENIEGLPEYNFGKVAITSDVKDSCVEIMRNMDIICTSTEFLAEYISKKFDIPSNKFTVVPNTVPQFFWGNTKKKPIKNKLVKPKVIWTGSPTHWHDEKRLPGDMDNAWQEWVIKNVIDGKIDYYQMGGCPYFFQSIKNKIHVYDWVNSFNYHGVIKTIRPDFSIGPLVPNYFNCAKSNLKAIESYAVGALFVGTTFDYMLPHPFNHKLYSPYDNCFVTVKDSASVKDIDEVFERYTEPSQYNEIIQKQYNFLQTEGIYTESARNINLLTSIF